MTTPVPMPISVPPALLHGRRSPLSWVTMIVLGLGGLLIAILVLISAGPGGALVITLLAAVSFPVLILICFWLDRYEPEPGRYRLAALGWGAVVAVGFSLVTEQVLFAVPDTSDFIDTAVTAPVLEELGKGLFLVAIVIFRREQVHGILDGIVYAALVGIGFAFVEDILYYLGSLNSDLASVFLVRGIIGPFAHPLFTSATGIGIGIAVTTKRPVVRIVAPIAGYLLAVAMHAIWNGSLFWGGRGFFIAYGVIILPLLVVIMVLAIWARSQEGKLLEASLSDIARLGWIRPEETRWISRLSDRMSARAYAKRLGGKSAQRALRVYQQTLIEVAFLHHRALQGTPPPDVNERMTALLQHATALRPYVILPPPPTAYGYPPIAR
jgi:RsiW-degrading membrane proteinase PrsW (M82 family)